jgi:WD40 repeat protein
MSGPGITLWDVTSGEKIRIFSGFVQVYELGFMIFSPDGRTIATGGNLGDIVLMEVQSGERRLTLVGTQGYGSGASWSVEDGSKVATVSFDGTCKVWDSSTGAVLRTIQVGTPMVRPVSVSWGRDWVRDTQRGVAFAMGHHPRIGAQSRVLALDTGVVRMILDRV